MNIMRGIQLQLRNRSDNYLSRIFKFVDIYKYVWHISEQEIYVGDNYHNSTLFSKEILTAKEFENCINISDKYYMIFVNIEAFPINADIVPIMSYADFKESDCFLTFICADCTDAALYCKDREIINSIGDNCDGENIKVIKWITDENDTFRFS